jgi:CRP/FNR family transcriptional regulator, cyclic AMP receptor protein
MSDDVYKNYENIMKIGFGGIDAIDDEIIKLFGKIFVKGEYLIKEGEHRNDVFLIMEGKVIVVKEVNTIKKALATLGPGEIFGEMSFFEREVRSASCIADERVVAIVFNQDNFSEICKLNPRWISQMLISLAKRIINTLEVLKARL